MSQANAAELRALSTYTETVFFLWTKSLFTPEPVKFTILANVVHFTFDSGVMTSGETHLSRLELKLLERKSTDLLYYK